MSRKRRFGDLVLTSEERGAYLTTDGEYLIAHVEGVTFCDHDHPLRDGTICYVGTEHPSWDWVVYQEHMGGWDLLDMFDTLNEAAGYLQAYLQQRQGKTA